MQRNELESTTGRASRWLPLFPYVVALGCTALQLLVALLQCGQGNLTERYRSFCKWDCGWYAEIAQGGYQSHLPPLAQDHGSNVAFFPGYPIFCGLVSRLTGLDIWITLPLVSTFWTFFTWYFFCRLLRRIGLSELGIVLTSFILLSHPGSFFLIMGYSESMFMAALFSVLDFSLANETLKSASAAFLATLTRVLGLPISLFPVLLRLFGEIERNSRSVRNSLFVPASACAAVLLFLGYCQLRFGVWDLYFLTQKIGWDIVPDHLFPLHAARQLHDALPWNRVLWISTWLLIAGAAILEAVSACFNQFSRQRGLRTSLYLCGFLLCYLSSAGVAEKSFVSFVRYSLPVCAMILLGLASFWVVAGKNFPRTMLAIGAVAIVLAIPSWAYMLSLTSKFLQGAWVG